MCLAWEVGWNSLARICSSRAPTSHVLYKIQKSHNITKSSTSKLISIQIQSGYNAEPSLLSALSQTADDHCKPPHHSRVSRPSHGPLDSLHILVPHRQSISSSSADGLSDPPYTRFKPSNQTIAGGPQTTIYIASDLPGGLDPLVHSPTKQCGPVYGNSDDGHIYSSCRCELSCRSVCSISCEDCTARCESEELRLKRLEYRPIITELKTRTET